jgi:hypothetical protein
MTPCILSEKKLFDTKKLILTHLGNMLDGGELVEGGYNKCS